MHTSDIDWEIFKKIASNFKVDIKVCKTEVFLIIWSHKYKIGGKSGGWGGRETEEFFCGSTLNTLGKTEEELTASGDFFQEVKETT